MKKPSFNLMHIEDYGRGDFEAYQGRENETTPEGFINNAFLRKCAKSFLKRSQKARQKVQDYLDGKTNE